MCELFLNSFEKARNYVICCISINEACSIPVNEPTGYIFSILHIPPEVSLPASEERDRNAM